MIIEKQTLNYILLLTMFDFIIYVVGEIEASFRAFLDIIIPRGCCSCGRALVRKELFICCHCLAEFPQTRFDCKEQTELEKRFWGRFPIERATALYYFHHEGVRHLIHRIKYFNNRKLALYMGVFMANQIKDRSTFFEGIDIIIPVPLHPKRIHRRGYNQSQILANGVSKSIGVYVDNRIIKRAIYNPTQTLLNRDERWDNVQDIFQLTDPDTIANKHILLIDDVLTTGSTIVACAQELMKAPNVKVSILTLAMARIH